MDTLLIVRRIREAEALADAGKHGDAKRMLQDVLEDGALTDAHRKLVTKKIELFAKQQERMTRIISRRGTAVAAADPSDESSAATRIRPLPGDDPSERPTDRTTESEPRGAPTEVVPRARDVDTEIPERGHKLKTTPAPPTAATDSAGMFPRVPERRTDTRARGAADSQELSPVDDDGINNDDTVDEDDPRATDIFVSPGDRTSVRDSVVSVPVDDESSPTITRVGMGQPGHDPAPGWNDTPVPESESAESGRDSEITVRDSIVVPPRKDVIPEVSGGNDDEGSTYLLADEHFKSVSSRRRERSNPELQALAERLPDDDLRRELALEVVRLRERLGQIERASARREEIAQKKTTRAGSRKIIREEKPESGSFHIPSSQVNTIVRRAAGTDQIEVHMPNRDDDAAELQVLRRDSVRGRKAQAEPTDRVALAQDYIDASSIDKPSLLKPLATWLGIAVMVGVVAWGVHLGYNSLAHAAESSSEVSEDGVGDYQIGANYRNYDELKNLEEVMTREIRGEKSGWIFQYDEDDKVVAITLPGPRHSARAKSRFNDLVVVWEGTTVRMNEGSAHTRILDELGEPVPEFSPQVWDRKGEYTLRFENRQGTRALEFHYLTDEPEVPAWIRVVNPAVERKPPDLREYLDAE